MGCSNFQYLNDRSCLCRLWLLLSSTAIKQPDQVCRALRDSLLNYFPLQYPLHISSVTLLPLEDIMIMGYQDPKENWDEQHQPRNAKTVDY